MILTLDLPNELESELANEAQMFGLSVADYSVRLLLSRPLPQKSPQSGSDLVKYWQNEGLIGTRAEIEDSQQHARKLRNKAESRHHKEKV